MLTRRDLIKLRLLSGTDTLLDQKWAFGDNLPPSPKLRPVVHAEESDRSLPGQLVWTSDG